MIDFLTLFPGLVKYLPNWLERFYPSMAQFAKGDGYPCGNQGVFIPKNRKCWTHPKTGQKLKKPLTYKMYQEAKVKSQRSRTERGRTAIENREQGLRQLNKKTSVPQSLAIDSEDKALKKMMEDLWGEEKKVTKPRNLFLSSKSKKDDVRRIRNRQMRNAEKQFNEQVKQWEKSIAEEAKTKRKEIVRMFDELDSKQRKSGGLLFGDQLMSESQDFDTYRRWDSWVKRNSKELKGLVKNGQDELIGKQERYLRQLKESKRTFEEFNKKVHKMLFVDNPTKINATLKPSTGLDNLSFKKGVNFISKMVDIPELDYKNVTIESAPKGTRGHFIASQNKAVIGSYKGGRDTRVVVHELGHWIEDNIPGARRDIADYYDLRTKGESMVSMNKVYNATNFNANEFTKPDKLITPYAGKVMKNGSEMLSVGLEFMYKHPAALAKKDPGLFDFIYKVVRRVARKK
jgi:hypothetical protein